MNVLVSIIVPCYNQAQFLDEALQSVFDQTYPHWECIIVNDGSYDDTEEVAKKWISKDIRFVYLKKENGGLSSARNLGLANIKGSYIQFLDSDDYIQKNKFELSLQQLSLNKEKDVNIVVSNFRMFTDSITSSSGPYCNLSEELFDFESMLYKWEESFTIPIHCGFFESSLFESFSFPENLKAKEDWVMWVTLFYKNCKAVFLDEPLGFYRINPESMTQTKDMLTDLLRAYEKFKEFLPEKEFHNLSLSLISRFYNKSAHFVKRHNDTKISNSYKTGNFIKKILVKLYLINFARQLLKK